MKAEWSSRGLSYDRNLALRLVLELTGLALRSASHTRIAGAAVRLLSMVDADLRRLRDVHA